MITPTAIGSPTSAKADVSSTGRHPNMLPRRDALLESGVLSVKLLAGSIPLLVIAGLIEAFISPTPIHPSYKFAVSVITGVALAIYLLSEGAER